MNVLDLFSGIGGFSLGLERAGMRTVAFCEIEPFQRAVLAKHWPGVPVYDDVRTLTAERLAADGIAVDVICGGFPCQDISNAGRQAGITGERSGLWSELCRLISELRPQFAIVENVANLLAGPSERPGEWFGVVLGDLAEIGFDAEWHCIPAGAVGAPHIRDRVWIVAYPHSPDDGRAKDGRAVRGRQSSRPDQAEGAHGQWHRRGLGDSGKAAHVADTYSQGRPNLSWGQTLAERSWLGTIGDTSRWQPEPAVGRVVDGLSYELARWRKRSVESLGNAVVPQIPEIIGRAIMSTLAKDTP